MKIVVIDKKDVRVRIDAEALNSIKHQPFKRLIEFGLFDSPKEIIKPLLIATSYHAGKHTASREFAHHIYKRFWTLSQEEKISEEQLSWVKSIIASSVDASAMKLTQPSVFFARSDVRRALMNYFKTTVGFTLYLTAQYIMSNLLIDYRFNSIDYTTKHFSCWEYPEELGVAYWRVMPYYTYVRLADPSHPDHNAYPQGSMKWAKKEYQNVKRYGIPTCSKRWIVTSAKVAEEKMELFVRREIRNEYAAVANMTQAIDAGELFFAHEMTRNLIQQALDSARKHHEEWLVKQLEDTLQSGIHLIHDGSNLNGYYASLFQYAYSDELIEAHRKYNSILAAAEIVYAHTVMDNNLPDHNPWYSKDNLEKEMDSLTKSFESFRTWLQTYKENRRISYANLLDIYNNTLSDL
jgi:hypothetical protein